jgi:hypothetical protein
MSEPTPEAIEAAKAGIRVHRTQYAHAPEHLVEGLARAALSAAAPYLVREAKAEALREAAAKLEPQNIITVWLKRRADRIEGK